jgi:hypothetical protein
MAEPVSKIAFIHTADIDEKVGFDASHVQQGCFIAAERAKDALKEPPAGYNELQGTQLADVIGSMQITHCSIMVLLTQCKGKPEIVDSLILARAQMEGLYNFFLMLESPEWTVAYLKDNWKKKYIEILLQKEEMKNLPRFGEFNTVIAPGLLEQGRQFCGVTDSEIATIDNEQLGVPYPFGTSKASIPSFPTPGRGLTNITITYRRRMLQRLYPEYQDLCSFAHGLPAANLLKGLLSSRSLHRKLFSEAQAAEVEAKDVSERAFITSTLSIAQCCAELAENYPSDVQLRAGALEAWQKLSVHSLLGNAIWEIRTRGLLGVL